MSQYFGLNCINIPLSKKKQNIHLWLIFHDGGAKYENKLRKNYKYFTVQFILNNFELYIQVFHDELKLSIYEKVRVVILKF